MNRKSEAPGNFSCPKGSKKVNFSSNRSTTLKISDMKP